MSKILVIDDLPENVFLLQDRLEHEGYEVITAYDGKTGIDKALNEIPDLILLDVMMPEIDGYTVYTKMCENEKTRNIPVVVLSAKGHVKDLFSMATNVVGFIEKPFDPDEAGIKFNKIIGDLVTRNN